MKQLSLAETGFLPKAGKQTRKAVFLAEMETVVPWSRLAVLIEPFYPKKGNGRPPMPLGTMLRIHFMQQWFGYSDPAMEEALHDIPLLRRFAGLDVRALQSVDGPPSLDAYDRRGAPVMRKVRGKASSSCGQRAKSALFSEVL